MNKRARTAINAMLAVVITTLVLLAAVAIALNVAGIRYIRSENGTRFFGTTENGIVLRGTVILPDGTEGKLDRRKGTIEYSNGDIYDGEFSGFYRHGEGSMLYTSTGDSYKGNFTDDTISGTGVYTGAGGNVYEGEFADGKKHGTGKYTWADGSYYEGGFFDNQKHGNGVYSGADGSSFVGVYENDKKNGYGEYTYANGDKYIGNFKDDMREDVSATYLYANGEKYVGGFSGNLKNGEGTYSWPSGRSYKGYFENGSIKVTQEN